MKDKGGNFAKGGKLDESKVIVSVRQDSEFVVIDPEELRKKQALINMMRDARVIGILRRIVIDALRKAKKQAPASDDL